MHHWTVRKMLPGVNGEAISISSGQTISKSYNFDLSGDHNGNDYWTVDDDMVVVSFVQTHTRTNAGSNRYAAEILQSTYKEFNAVPNKAPYISQGQLIAPPGATEDDEVTFKTFYWDVDDAADRGPAVAKVFYKNTTSGVMEHDLTPVPSGIPWMEGKWLQWKTKLDAGTYSYRFAANDSEDDALGDTAWNATQVTILPRNKVPQLSTYSYAPIEGDTTTMFRYDVMYRDFDNDAPVDAILYLNDVAYTMDTGETSVFTEWVTYYYETTMAVGENHRFYFSFSDGKDMVRLPAVDASPNWLRGPSVTRPNNAPSLNTALFDPDEGTRMDQFTFTIIYTDGENDHPTVSYIYIDEVPNIMSPDGFSYQDGEVFRFRTTLDIGEHNIRFLFNDGKTEVRFPPTGVMPGPTVINMDPEGGIAAPTDGMRYTPDDFVPFSAVGSDDPEDDPLEFKWISSIDGELSTQEAFDKRLSEGEHVITLEVTDEYGGLNTVTVSITVKALVPEPFVVSHVSSNTDPVDKDNLRYTFTLDNKGEAVAQGIEVKFIVDGVLVNSDTVSVSVGNQVEVRFSWEAMYGLHTIRVEIPGDSYEFDENVAHNSPPIVTTDIVNEGGKETSYKEGVEVYFSSVVTDENDDDVDYLWDFGDGTTSSQTAPGHIYTEKGTYTVTLTVTDSRGGVSTDTFTVEIIKKKASGGESPGFGAIVAIAAFMAVIVAVSRRRM
jgi:PGF-CTERM protein